MVIVPYLVMAPGLFTGAITLGFVIQVSNAFARVHSSFSLFTQNWTTITELRSLYKSIAFSEAFHSFVKTYNFSLSFGIYLIQV